MPLFHSSSRPNIYPGIKKASCPKVLVVPIGSEPRVQSYLPEISNLDYTALPNLGRARTRSRDDLACVKLD